MTTFCGFGGKCVFKLMGNQWRGSGKELTLSDVKRKMVKER